MRHFIPIEMTYGTKTVGSDKYEWYVRAWCLDRHSWRSFSMSDFLTPWEPYEVT